MTQAHIERFFGNECLFPGLTAIGQSRQISAREGWIPHSEEYFEIHLITQGTVDWWVEETTYHVPPGSVFITKPGEVHGVEFDIVQPCTLTWLQVDPSYLSDINIQTEMNQMKHRTWLGAQYLIDDVVAMLDECRTPKPDSERMIAAHLHVFLATLLRQYHAALASVDMPEMLESMLQYIDQHLYTRLSVQDLCDHASLSRSRVFQLFEQYVGQSPGAYAMTRRLLHARQLLEQDRGSITKVAHELGFSSSQHFSTVFKRYFGQSPKAYQLSRTSKQK